MRNLIFLSLFMLLIAGCGNDTVVSNDLAYKQKLVIRGIVQAGDVLHVYISTTLPPWTAYDSVAAEVVDANVFMVHNTNDTIPLYYIGNQQYRGDYNIRAQMGDLYTIFAKWHNLVATATTKIPTYFRYENPSMGYDLKANGKDTNFYVQLTVYPNTDAVYGAAWRLSGFSYQDSVMGDLARYKDRDASGKVIVKSRPCPNQLVWFRRTLNLELQVSSYDEPYYNYYMSQSSNLATDNVFGRSGTNQQWNVTGDGIGIFCGRTDTLMEVTAELSGGY